MPGFARSFSLAWSLPVAGLIVRIAKRKRLDLMVLGGHGHRGLSDVLYGETITRVRHELDIPIIASRASTGVVEGTATPTCSPYAK